MSKIQWTDVTSSNVEAVTYDSLAMTVAVKFLGGSIYTYDGVGEQTYSNLANSPSVGRYLNEAIKGAYPYLKHDSEDALIEHISKRRENS